MLDEAQLLPPEFLSPILKALDELRKHYGVTILLCTATQPALGPHKSSGFTFEGLEGIREIMEDPANLYYSLKRVEVKLPENIHEPRHGRIWPRNWPNFLQCSASSIVGTTAAILWSLMPEDTFHLSALMCGAHRSDRIAEIKARLERPCPPASSAPNWSRQGSIWTFRSSTGPWQVWILLLRPLAAAIVKAYWKRGTDCFRPT